MIKKIFGVFIFVLLSISFSSADYTWVDIGNPYNNFVGVVQEGLNFLDSNNNKLISRVNLSDSYNTSIWWGEDGLYFNRKNVFTSSQNGNGYIQGYFICDDNVGIIGAAFFKNYPGYCVYHEGYDGLNDILGDVYQYALFGTNTSSYSFFQLCGKYDVNKNICFDYSYVTIISSTFYSYSELINNGYGTLDNPFYGTSSNGSNNNINFACTKQTALNWYERYGYSDRLCYGGLNDYTINTGTALGTLPVYGTGEDYQEIWLQTADLRQNGLTGSGLTLENWFGYRRGLYKLYKRGTYEDNPFLNTPWVLYTYFGAIDVYGLNYNDSSIIEYCDLKLYTSDYTVDYTGVNQNSVCDVSNLILDYGTGSNGINVVGTGEDVTDGISFITNYYDLLQEKIGDFDSDNDSPILPTYIIWTLVGLLIFRFISH